MGDLEPTGQQVPAQRQPQPVPPLAALRAVDWQSVKHAASERYSAESRMAYGAQITERAQEGLDRIRRRLESTGREPDELDAMLVSSFAFGAAELIQDYMRRR